MKKLIKIAPFIIIAAAAIILLIPRRSPIERTFDEAIKAANSHDYARFCHYVNVEEVIKSYLNLHSPEGRSLDEKIRELEARVRYFIETERIPDSDRFKNLVSTRITEDKARAQIALELKRYSITCTTSVYLYSRPDSGWQIQNIGLDQIFRKMRDASMQRNKSKNGSASSMEPLTPEVMVRDILYDDYYLFGPR